MLREVLDFLTELPAFIAGLIVIYVLWGIAVIVYIMIQRPTYVVAILAGVVLSYVTGRVVQHVAGRRG